MTKTTKIIIACAVAAVAIVLGSEIFKTVRFRILCESTERMNTRIDTVLTVGTQARRGDIVDCKGNVLATIDTVYGVYFDTTVPKDSLWQEALPVLSGGLAEILGDRTPAEYFAYLTDGRTKGKKFIKICKNVGQSTLDSLKGLPLFNLSMYKGGVIIETMQKRVYPYGPLARRTIGFVRSNNELYNNNIGIEGFFNKALSGTDGYEVIKDRYARLPFGKVRHIRKTLEKVESANGERVRIVMDIKMQAVADSLLRAAIKGHKEIKGACLVTVSTNSGAIRTMVNLTRDVRGDIGEYYNISIGYGYEPGRIIAPATALAASKCDSTLSLDGLDLISKDVLADMAGKCYPPAYCDTLKELLNAGYTLDHIELEGLEGLKMITPENNSWCDSYLSSIANGYSIMAPAFQWLNLYTGIARGGDAIAQRLVGTLRSADGKRILNDPIMVFVPDEYSICTKGQADALTSSLKRASAKQLSGTAYEMAGLFATSFITHPNGGYADEQGRRAVQSSYAGFFPADRPAFSIICMVYMDFAADSRSASAITKKVVRDFVGSDIVAARVKETFE